MSQKNVLNVYAAVWCPHCRHTVDFLEKHKIPFNYINIEDAPDNIVDKVVEVNGGVDWVVPTLELNGVWRPGKPYNEIDLVKDLKKLGIQL